MGARRTLHRWPGLLLGAFLFALWVGACAQEYPNRPIRLVLGFPSGGTPDALARSVTTQLEAQLKRSIVVDNRTGANGIIAAEIVATALPDGYTMLFSPPALIINQILQKKVPYDVLKDFTPVANICLGAGFILVVNPSVPPTVVMPHIKAGKLRALAFTGAKRWQFMPELPTIAEAGVPGFEVSGSWQGWFAPARVPREIVARLHGEIRRALQEPKVHDFILTGGYEPDGRGPEEFRKLIQSDFKKYAEIIRVAGIKAE